MENQWKLTPWKETSQHFLCSQLGSNTGLNCAGNSVSWNLWIPCGGMAMPTWALIFLAVLPWCGMIMVAVFWSTDTVTKSILFFFLIKLKLSLLDLHFYKVPSIPKCYKISTLFTLINDALSEWWILLGCNLKDNIIPGRTKRKFKWEFRAVTRWNPTTRSVVIDVRGPGGAGSQSHAGL